MTFIPLFHVISFFFLLPTSCTADKLADGIVEWFVSKGGYFSSKLEIRGLTNANDPTLGVFAKQDIDPKEQLLFVPQSTYIRIPDEAIIPPNDDDDDASYYYQMYCTLSKKLQEEILKGGDSDYAPYINYLQQQRRGQVPATWSPSGKDVLRAVLPADHDGVDWIDRKFAGCINNSDTLEEHVVALTLQRGYDRALIPIWDMFNHKNGHVNVENDSIWEKDGFRLRASRKIKAGEEIYATYDKCVDCGSTWWYWGTPEILRDFGFVEDYRRRFVFDIHDIWFEIDYNENGELEVIWDIAENYAEVYPPETLNLDDKKAETDDVYGIPTKDAVAFLRGELERLNTVGKTVLKHAGNVPEHEWETILQYHRATTEAIQMAIDAASAYHDRNSSQEL